MSRSTFQPSTFTVSALDYALRHLPGGAGEYRTELERLAVWATEQATEDHSGPCHACGNHVEDTMAQCPSCGYDGNEGRFTDEDSAAHAYEAVITERLREHMQTLDAIDEERDLRDFERDHGE